MATKLYLWLAMVTGLIHQIALAKSARSVEKGDDTNASEFPPPLVKDYRPGDTCYDFTHGDWRKRTFTSPNYPLNYSNKTECISLLVAPKGHTLLLDWRDHFELEASEDCKFDFLEIRNGPYGYSPLIGRYCGTNFPGPINSKTRYLWLRFVSDDSVEWKGFKAVYSFLLDPNPELQYSRNFSVCLINVINAHKVSDLRILEQQFSTSSIPHIIRQKIDDHLLPLDCTWVIHIPRGLRMFLKFTEFSIASKHCDDSSLEIYDSTTSQANRVKLLCNSEAGSTEYMSVSNRLLLRARAEELENAVKFSAFFSVLYSGPCKHDSLFRCGDNTCVNKSLLCNGRVNCATEWDELECDGVEKPDDKLKTIDSSSHVEMTDYHTIILGVIGGLLFVFIVICICITCVQRNNEVSRSKPDRNRLGVGAGVPPNCTNRPPKQSTMQTELKTLLSRSRTPPFDTIDSRHMIGNNVNQCMQFSDIYTDPSGLSQCSDRIYADRLTAAGRPYTPSLDRYSATVSVGIQTNGRTQPAEDFFPPLDRTAESIPGELDRFYSTPLCGEFAKRLTNTPSSTKKFPTQATIERPMTPQVSGATNREQNELKVRRSNSMRERVNRTPSPRPDIVQLAPSIVVSNHKGQTLPPVLYSSPSERSRSKSRLDPSIFNEHSSAV
ncbi:neuropilin and tolloid-like protein 1 [Tubulanus polymorphus]|uniref:neuropilin and tolloid-like protein 1 n=1 Tax=Tubulanus polymorphus TaxID=672921 RepID=UPI003DA3CB86